MNAGHGNVKIARDDRASATREIANFIMRNPNVFGGADIYNLDFGTPIARAAILLAVLTCLVDEEGRPAIRKYIVVAPPGVDPIDAAETAWTQFVESFKILADRPIERHETEVIKSKIVVKIAGSLRHNSIIQIVAAQPEKSAIIVLEASRYRNDEVDPYIASGASTPLQPEDVWAPQLHALASAATRIAGENSLYVAFDSNELSPRRQELAELLFSIDGCGVMGASSDDDLSSILALHVDQWDAWIREGKLGQALRDVASLPSALDRQKAFLQIQLLSRAGHREQALQAIREWLKVPTDLNDSSRVKLARIAQNANASNLAAELLAPVLHTLGNREDLESVLATVHEARLPDLEEIVATRLEGLFPGSVSLLRRQLVKFTRARNFGEAATVARNKLGDGRLAVFYETLEKYLSTKQVPDYHGLIAEARDDVALAAAFRIASGNDALTRKLLVHAFELAMPLRATPEHADRGERLLLKTLKALLLVSSKENLWPISQDRFQAAVLALIERLAANPDNRTLRIGLVELMQPAIAGSAGLAIMAMLVLQLASRPIKLRKGGAPGRAGMDWLMKREPFLTTGFAWMKAEEPIVIGRSVLPVDLLTESADEVVSAVADYLTHAPPGTSEDKSSMLTWLTFGAAVAPHSSDPDYDLRLIRLVAGKFASVGDVQQARDLAEQALINSNGSARRRRLGWFALADIYVRGGNAIEGLIAMACTLVADDSGDEEEIYQEVTGVARLLRDCGLHDQARIAIGNARTLLESMDLLDRYGHQLDTLELQLRQMGLRFAGNFDAALSTLLVDVVANSREVLRYHGLTAPAGAVLGQLIRTARLRGLAIPADADATFDELQRHAGGSFSKLVATMSAEMPTAEDLLSIMKNLGSARYSDDVGFDLRNIEVAAGRALISDDLLRDPESTAFVLDVLADRGVALPGWDEAAVPAPPPASVVESSEIARIISLAGVSVVQAGFDEDGRLVRLATSAGELGQPVRESVDVIHKERFKQWAEQFPYNYGVDESTANLFYTTTADVRLSQLPSGPVVVAADATFQAFPPNLLYIDGEFAGRTRPMAATPSLAWLGRAREMGHVGDGRMCAWISTAVGSESQTLPMIAERLQPTFEQYGFAVDNGPVLPTVFAGATLAVVTAHGGVHPEGRFFRVVSDEGNLRVTAADLANTLRNIGVVVLFVCSGGRADKHPAANTTLGLAKQIVDRGCSAVVASPWPLDARVPSHWLPTFLERWTRGATLIEANYFANQVVDQRFGQDPARGLAMTVYGNPELAITAPSIGPAGQGDH